MSIVRDEELQSGYLWMKNTKLNKAQCRICKDIIESKHVHDWVSCKGGHIFIDGGPEYRRCGILKKDVSFDDILWIEEGLKNDVIEAKEKNDAS